MIKLVLPLLQRLRLQFAMPMRLLRDQCGNTLAIFAAALVPITLMIGSGLDLGVMYMARAKLQNACDAGVLAGRQAMSGNVWTSASQAAAAKFFAVNFPAGMHGVADASFQVSQDQQDNAQLIGSASGTVPTSLMRLADVDTLPIAVNCSAKRDLGHNDLLLVLDVTGSMNHAPSNGGGTKIGRLRTGAVGLFRALDDDSTSVTRFGIVPYSHTVNVARSLRRRDILRDQDYLDGNWSFTRCDSNGYYIWNCQSQTSGTKPAWGLSNGNTIYTYNITFSITGSVSVAAKDSSWATNNHNGQSIDTFRFSGDGCIEERPSIGNAANPVTINNSVSLADVNDKASAWNDAARQFGRYDPDVQQGQSQVGCPSEAQKLQTYADETAFNAAINAATARVTGGTYHDVGMLWGLRFLSRNGFFANDNPTQIDGVPVAQHIVFMTDGILDTGPTLYASHGVETYQQRTLGGGSQDQKHLDRFDSACNLAKSMGITVWVIALDVANTDDVEPCATTSAHFYTSDGSDLEEVFAAIGQGIGNLRLTQ